MNGKKQLYRLNSQALPEEKSYFLISISLKSAYEGLFIYLGHTKLIHRLACGNWIDSISAIGKKIKMNISTYSMSLRVYLIRNQL